jgi:hypothetical protein
MSSDGTSTFLATYATPLLYYCFTTAVLTYNSALLLLRPLHLFRWHISSSQCIFSTHILTRLSLSLSISLSLTHSHTHTLLISSDGTSAAANAPSHRGGVCVWVSVCVCVCVCVCVAREFEFSFVFAYIDMRLCKVGGCAFFFSSSWKVCFAVMSETNTTAKTKKKTAFQGPILILYPEFIPP